MEVKWAMHYAILLDFMIKFYLRSIILRYSIFFLAE